MGLQLAAERVGWGVQERGAVAADSSQWGWGLGGGGGLQLVQWQQSKPKSKRHHLENHKTVGKIPCKLL